MKRIVIIGAGLSTQSLVPYLKQRLEQEQWYLRVLDRVASVAAERLGESNAYCSSGALDIMNVEELSREVEQAFLVISMVPSHMHLGVAQMCLDKGVHLLTASYLIPAIKDLDDQVQQKGLIFLNECGLDPGIDHMSAMRLLDGIRNDGGRIKLFESFTGGLLSPGSEGANPWRYKFTWNPRNVVLAGQGGSVKFIQEGKYKYIPPHMVFRRTEFMTVEGYGRFEGLANRDSLKYRSAYGLDDVDTLYRGTLRRPGFARAWDCFVKLGMTDDSFTIKNTDQLSFRDFTNLFLAYNPFDSVELKLMHYLNIPQDSDIMDKLQWSGIFSQKTFPFNEGTPAQCLEYILRQVWTLEESDKDLIVMFHKVGWEKDGKEYMIESSMGVEGENAKHTAMATTVGLPLAIAAKNILHENIATPGVQLPLTPEWYNPILEELESDFGISFIDKEVTYKGY